MSLLYHLAVAPFIEYSFLRRALVACMALSLGGTPVGIFLLLRRMTLVGDALSHAILPGVALAFLAFGLSLWPMTLGGLLAGLVVAFSAGAVARTTPLREDASFTGIYLLSLAGGVVLISLHGSSIDLMHVLFGNVLGIGNPALVMMTSVASLSLLLLAIFYRGLVVECLDADFLRVIAGGGAGRQALFLTLLVVNLVCAYQTLGTLMALGLLVLPAIASRLWTRQVDHMVPTAIAFALLSSYAGLLLSYHAELPSGPSIVLIAGGIYVVSLICGTHGGWIRRPLFAARHVSFA